MGGWSSKGCELFSRSQSHIACQCNHMTSFAVLMDISKREVSGSLNMFLLATVVKLRKLLKSSSATIGGATVMQAPQHAVSVAPPCAFSLLLGMALRVSGRSCTCGILQCLLYLTELKPPIAMILDRSNGMDVLDWCFSFTVKSETWGNVSLRWQSCTHFPGCKVH